MIPWLLIAVGGVMIYAGLKGDSPVNVIKSVLTNGAPTTETTKISDAVSPGINQHLGG